MKSYSSSPIGSYIYEYAKLNRLVITDIRIIATSDLSTVSLISLDSGQKIILKVGKVSEVIMDEYFNHSNLYSHWQKHKDKFDFKIPRPLYFFQNHSSYLMEYVEGAKSLDEVFCASLMDSRSNLLPKLFARVGVCLAQYHTVFTQMRPNTKSVLDHDSVDGLLSGSGKKEYLQIYRTFPKKCYRNILKDFKPQNILVAGEDIYFIDFQKIDYSAPLYYDLARFIDTLHLFTFLEKPDQYFKNRKYLAKSACSFLSGYGEVNMRLLSACRRLHQLEHVYIKRKKALNAFILFLFYKLIIPKV